MTTNPAEAGTPGIDHDAVALPVGLETNSLRIVRWGLIILEAGHRLLNDQVRLPFHRPPQLL